MQDDSDLAQGVHVTIHDHSNAHAWDHYRHPQWPHLDILFAILLMDRTKTIHFKTANIHALNNPYSPSQTCGWAFGVCEHRLKKSSLFIYLILEWEERRSENEVPDTHFLCVQLWLWNCELLVKEWSDGEMSFEQTTLRVSGKQAWTPGRHFLVKGRNLIPSILAFRKLGIWYELASCLYSQWWK